MAIPTPVKPITFVTFSTACVRSERSEFLQNLALWCIQTVTGNSSVRGVHPPAYLIERYTASRRRATLVACLIDLEERLTCALRKSWTAIPLIPGQRTPTLSGNYRKACPDFSETRSLPTPRSKWPTS